MGGTLSRADASIHPVPACRRPCMAQPPRAACAATMSAALSRTRFADSPVSSRVLRSQSTMAKPSTVPVASASASAPSNPLTRTVVWVAAVAEQLETHVDMHRAVPVEGQVARRLEARHRHLGRGARHHELPLHPRTRRQRPAGIAQPELAQGLRVDEGGEHLARRATDQHAGFDGLFFHGGIRSRSRETGRRRLPFHRIAILLVSCVRPVWSPLQRCRLSRAAA